MVRISEDAKLCLLRILDEGRMKQFRPLILVAALAASVFGQVFEIASVREADPALAAIRGSIEANQGRLIIRNATLRDAIKWAYDEEGARVEVLGGPHGPIPFDMTSLQNRQRLRPIISCGSCSGLCSRSAFS